MTQVAIVTSKDLEDYQLLIHSIKNPTLKKLLQDDFQEWNDKVSKSDKSIQQQLEMKDEIVEEEYEEEVDFDEYEAQKLRGFKQKVKSIQSSLPDKTYEEIRDALIRTNGNEGNALEGLLTGELPKRKEQPPPGGKIKIKKTRKVVKKTFNASNAVIMEQSDVAGLLVDRIKSVNRELDTQRKHIDELLQNIDKAGISKASKRMYLPGEYEALQGDVVRYFTFLSERTFSNEVSHIHFRVAESEFHRLLSSKNVYRVIEVKYVCSPQLVRRFERRRAEIANEMSKKFEQVKPILTFHGCSQNDIKWICENGYRNANEGLYCSELPEYTTPFINQGNVILLCLVLPGNAQIVSNVKEQLFRDSGYHSVMSENGLECKIWNDDQILPYYIVKYEKMMHSNVSYGYANYHAQVKSLDEEFKVMEEDAKADKFMDDTKRFYQEVLLKKNAEKKENDLWFDQVYKKRFEEEEGIGGIEDLLSPTSTASFEYDDEEEEMSIETPPTATSQKEFPDVDE